MSEEKKAKTKSVGVNTYARVRIFFKDRESLTRAVKAKSSKENNGGKGVLTTFASADEGVRTMTTEFTDVLGTTVGNEQAYEVICIPLINKVLLGFKGLLIAYGQTGSGKTFSLIGAKGPGQLGLLPRTIQAFLTDEKVLKLQMKAFEAYSTTLTKIGIFDLFHEKNKFEVTPFEPPSDDRAKNKAAEYKWVQKKSAAAQSMWKTKYSKTGTDTFTEGIVHDINDIDDAFIEVEKAHDASHFAKTGKNPESSRGHTVYIVKLKITNPQGADYTPLTTEFVVVDLAGSEGGNTLDALPDGPAKTCRFLEGGVINYGLTALKDMFGEMRKKGKLKKSQGNGLRKLLYPFVTSNTMMSICFTLSPSMDNIMATRATMKFAQDACKLKMKPVADSGGRDWKKAYEKLKVKFDEKVKTIESLQNHVDAGIEHAESSSGGTDTHFKELLAHLLADEQDHVIGLFRKYELMQYVPDKVVYEVKDAIQSKKADYIPLLHDIYTKKNQKMVGQEESLLDDAVKSGVGMHTFYEHQCDKYGAKVKVEKKQINSRTLEHVKQGPEEATASAQKWADEARKLKKDVAKKVAKSKMEVMDLEADLKAGYMNMSVEDDYKSSNAYDIGSLGMEEEMTTDTNVRFEDLDLSQPPHFFSIMQEMTQAEIIEAFKNPNNFSRGEVSTIFNNVLTHKYGFTDNQVSDLRTYMMIVEGKRHDVEQVQNFAVEMGGVSHSDALGMMQDTESLQEILELKNKVHQLENEKRVESTMKLWESMRLRIRDRKLKKKEDEVLALQTKLKVIQSMVDNNQIGGSNAGLEEKIDSIYEVLTHGSDDNTEMDAKVQACQKMIAQKDQQINALNNAMKTGNASQIAQELTLAHAENVRYAGRLDEIRHTIKNQSRIIDILKQQIFIVLHFPKHLEVHGRVGFNASMNGHYSCGERLHAGRVYYKNNDNDWVIRWYPQKSIWLFDWRGLGKDDMGGAAAHQDVPHPLLVTTPWAVFDEGTRQFQVDQKIVLSAEMEMSHKNDAASQSGKRHPTA